MRLRHRVPIRIDCTCHDPTVFGHLTCSRRETQHNPDPNMAGITELSIACGTITAGTLTAGQITQAILAEATNIRVLDVNLRETARQVENLTAVLEYIERRYSDPPPHG